MKVLNFGSLNLDQVYTVPHLVRPGETLSSLSFQVFPGGKGLNQSVALAKSGAAVFHGGAVGTDGGLLLDLLREAGADVSLVKVLPDCPTGRAVIQVDAGGQNSILLWGGANQAITPEQVQAAFEGFGPGDLLLCQNETSALAEIIRAGREKGMRVALNPSPMNEKIEKLPLELVEFFLVNQLEGAALGGGETPEEILAGLRRRFPQAKLVLTLGEEGAYYFDGQETYFQPAFPVKAVDTTGAGDTFTGYFLAGVLEGLGGQECLRRGAAAAALAVSRQGAAPSIPAAEEVRSFAAE